MKQDGSYLDHTKLEILKSPENCWQLRLRGPQFLKDAHEYILGMNVMY